MQQSAQGQHNNWPRRACDHGGGYNYDNWGEGEHWYRDYENQHHKKKSQVDMWPQSIHIPNGKSFFLSLGGSANFRWYDPACPNDASEWANVTGIVEKQANVTSEWEEKQTSVYLEGAANKKELSSTHPPTLHPSVTQPLLDYQTSWMRRSATMLNGGGRNAAILTTLSTTKIPRRASGFGCTPSASVAEKEKVYLHILTGDYNPPTPGDSAAPQSELGYVVFTLQSGEERQNGVRMKNGATYHLKYDGPGICPSTSLLQFAPNLLQLQHLPTRYMAAQLEHCSPDQANCLWSTWMRGPEDFHPRLTLRCRHVRELAQGYDDLQIPILLEMLDLQPMLFRFEPMTGQALGRENRILIVQGVSGCVENSIFDGKMQDFVNLYSARGCADTEKRDAHALINEFPAWRHGRADTSSALPFFSGIQHSSKRNWGGNASAHGSAATFATSASGVSYNGAACNEVTPSTAAGCDVDSFEA